MEGIEGAAGGATVVIPRGLGARGGTGAASVCPGISPDRGGLVSLSGLFHGLV